MSDNITREPYRNAWYKQLQEEVSKMKPHLVPEVENDDNGKILVAGQEGTFGWAQPPEELPVITESDEGKVLKVDSGVPKWLADSDDEYLVVTVTESEGVYSANYTFDEIHTAISNNQGVVVRYDKYYLALLVATDNRLDFQSIVSIHGPLGDTVNNVINSLSQYYECEIIQIKPASVSHLRVAYFTSMKIDITDGSTLSTNYYNWLKSNFNMGEYVPCVYNNILLYPSKSSSNYNTMEFINPYEGIKASINSSRRVTISSIPKLPAPTSADEGKVLMVDANGDYTLGTVQGGSPHYAEVSLGISVE